MLEELSPKVLGVGAPFLMMVALYVASTGRTQAAAIAVALACGAAEDALCSLGGVTSIPFFVSAALLARRTPFASAVMMLACPAYQLWLWIWMPELGGAVFGRFLVSLPAGASTAIATALVMAFAERRVGVVPES